MFLAAKMVMTYSHILSYNAIYSNMTQYGIITWCNFIQYHWQRGDILYFAIYLLTMVPYGKQNIFAKRAAVFFQDGDEVLERLALQTLALYQASRYIMIFQN